MGAIEFTAQLTTAASGSEWRAACREVESLGYRGLSISDHLGAQLGPIAALAAAAAATDRLRLGFNVLANDFRHPAVLAKELATLDVVSDGRIDVGLGAGWMRTDYTASGLAFDTPNVRINRLIEAVAVLRGLWSDTAFTFVGEHYRITDLAGTPPPVQRGGPSILLGGGARRMLTTAGALADVVGIALDNRAGIAGSAPAASSATAAAMRAKLAWVREGAASGHRPLPPVSVRVLGVRVTDDRWKAAVELGRALGLDAASVLESPHALVGTDAQIVEDLRARREEFGIERYVVSQNVLRDLAPVVSQLALMV